MYYSTTVFFKVIENLLKDMIRQYTEDKNMNDRSTDENIFKDGKHLGNL